MPSITHFTERLKLHRIHPFIRRNWNVLKNHLSEDNYKTEQFSHAIFCELIGKKNDQWAKLLLRPKDGEISIDKFSELKKKNSVEISTNDIFTEDWAGKSDKYTDISDKLISLFGNIFEWNPDTISWQFKKLKEIAGDNSATHRLLNNLLQPNLVDGFAGSYWYMYKRHQKGGAQRMILTVSDSVNEEGFYTVKILTRYNPDEEVYEADTIYKGIALTDKKGRTIFILEDRDEQYAHMILFTQKVASISKREICVGHFTFFSKTPHVKKYLTKSIIMLAAPKQALEVKHVTSSTEDLIIGEDLVLRYLRDKQLNRLTSIDDHIYYLRGFQQWLEKYSLTPSAEKEEKESIYSYLGDYHVFYVKKHPKGDSTENRMEFFQDKLNLSLYAETKTLNGTYEHLQSLETGFIHERTKIHSDYKGSFNVWSNYLFGQLLSNEGGPLFLTMLIRERGLIKTTERFIGTLVGERDSGVVTVAYTCVVVPFSILEGLNDGIKQKKIEKIKDYLEGEARKGWGVIDPPRHNVNSFSIDDLRSDDN
ncbi:hypothetical protein GCM10028807_23620 [Spirosoma daeguense]